VPEEFHKYYRSEDDQKMEEIVSHYCPSQADIYMSTPDDIGSRAIYPVEMEQYTLEEIDKLDEFLQVLQQSQPDGFEINGNTVTWNGYTSKCQHIHIPNAIRGIFI